MSSIQDIELPRKLLRLARHPLIDALDPGTPWTAAGLAVVPPGGGNDDDAVAARMWAAALRSHILTARVLVPRIERKLDIANTLQLGADIVNATSVGALLALVWGSNSARGYKLAIAAIAVATSAVSAVVSFLRRTPRGGIRSDQLAALLTKAGEAESVAIELEIWATTAQPRAPLDATVLAHAKTLISEFTVVEEARQAAAAAGERAALSHGGRR